MSYSHHKTTKAKNNDALQDCFSFACWVKRKKAKKQRKRVHPPTRRRTMQLTLDRIALQVGSQSYLYPLSLAPVAGAMTVLLGATLAGKTSPLRIMARLGRPTEGGVRAGGRGVRRARVARPGGALAEQRSR